ncbi:MAG: hypothetical protein K2N01_11640 [Lachnospiraceae bacterium]|nr:hypothetical protein [Lachnospiraceae bacterium]
MKRHSNFGFSSILLAFVMICIATFSALSLLTANSDYRLSKRVAERNQAYYQAQENAWDRLASIDQALLSAYEYSNDPAEYYENARSFISDAADGTWSNSEESHCFSYTESVANNQHLEVIIELQYPANSTDSFYRIIQWKTVQTSNIQKQQPLNLMGSDEQR